MTIQITMIRLMRRVCRAQMRLLLFCRLHDSGLFRKDIKLLHEVGIASRYKTGPRLERDVPCAVNVGELRGIHTQNLGQIAKPDVRAAPNGEMGLLTILKRQKQKEREVRLLMLGLDNAGKTTVVKKFNGENIDEISPTLGFNIKTLEYRGYKLNVWDVGGQTSLRSYWRNYFEQTDGLVWVVDSADRARLLDCKAELQVLLQQEVCTPSLSLMLALVPLVHVGEHNTHAAHTCERASRSASPAPRCLSSPTSRTSMVH